MGIDVASRPSPRPAGRPRRGPDTREPRSAMPSTARSTSTPRSGSTASSCTRPAEALELVKSLATAQVRRDRRGGVPPRRRPPQGRPDDPRHGLAAQRHRQDRPGGGVRPGRRRPEAEEAGADVVGADDLVARIEGGFLDFDVAIATPDLMGQVGKLGRRSAPAASCRTRRPAPSPTTSARRSASSRPARSSTAPTATATCTCRSARPASTPRRCSRTTRPVLDELLRAKPAAAKGRYLKGVTIISTMGPGVQIDPTETRDLARGGQAAA